VGVAPRLGIRRPGLADSFPSEIDVTLCSLDNPEAVLPKDHTWTRSSLSWIKLADGLPSYRESRQKKENSRT
jgi:hypothetical protein